jgi:hypothetical protein
MDIGGRIRLEWILDKWNGVVWNCLCGLPLEGSCEQGSVPLGYITFLRMCLSDLLFLKMDSAP